MLKTLARRWRFLLGTAVILGAVVWAFESSYEFQACVSADQNQNATQDQKSFDVIPRSFQWANLRYNCLGFWFNGNRDSLSAVSAILLTIITFGLVWTALRQEQTTRRQLRAYVLPENAGLFEGLTLPTPEPTHAGEPGIVLAFKNSGQTPAFQYVSWAQIAVEEPAKINRLAAPSLKPIFPASIGANGLITKAIWFGRPLTTDEIADVSVAKKLIVVYGRLEYRDLFDRPHWTNFRLQYAGRFPPLPNAIFNFSETGNSSD